MRLPADTPILSNERPLAGRGVSVAYLTNVYPKFSHSFIRAEIEALERAGLSIERFTIRRSPVSVAGEEEEVRRTTALLEGNAKGLALAVLGSFARKPGATIGALLAALRLGGARGVVRSVAYFAEAAALAQELTHRKIGHVHVHFGTNAVDVMRLARRLAPLTYSFTVHGPDEFDAPRPLDLRGKIADAAFVVGVSSFGRGQLMRWADLADWGKINVVRCSVATHFLTADDPLPPPDTARLVCVARLSAQKGLPLLIEAAAGLAARRDFVLDIIGEGEDRAMIEAQIADLGIGERVKLLGSRSPEEVRQALEASRAFVLPSFAEGLPVVLMEALAVGRPVVATAIAGIPELVDDDTGWLIPSGSAADLAQAMEAALDTPPERLGAMGQAGRARVLAMHHPDTNAGVLAGLLQAAASN